MFNHTHFLLVQKWVKRDAYLFKHGMPVIKIAPRGADLSSGTHETIPLDDIISVWHISKFFKHNVLALGFSSCYVLIAFGCKSQRELWYAELKYLTGMYYLCDKFIFSYFSDCMIKLYMQTLLFKLCHVDADTLHKLYALHAKYMHMHE